MNWDAHVVTQQERSFRRKLHRASLVHEFMGLLAYLTSAHKIGRRGIVEIFNSMS